MRTPLDIFLSRAWGFEKGGLDARGERRRPSDEANEEERRRRAGRLDRCRNTMDEHGAGGKKEERKKDRVKSVTMTPNDAWLRPKPPKEVHREANLPRTTEDHTSEEDKNASKTAYFEEKKKWAKEQQQKFKYGDVIEDPKRPVAPLRDRPVKPGPYFEYELTNNQRVVHELDGVNYHVGGFKPHKARWWDEKFVRLLGTKPMHEPGRKIVRFSEKRLLKFDWLWTWRGTILSSSFIWSQLAIVYLIGGITFIVAYFAQTSKSGRFYEEHINGGTDDLVEVLEIFDEMQEIATIGESLTLLVAFVLGLYVTKQVDIFWNIRQEFFQGVLNSVQSICIRMAIYFPSNNREDVDARETVLRYGLLSTALLFKDAAEVDVWTMRQRHAAGVHDLSDLVRDGLLTEQEAGLLQHCPAKSQVVWVWIASFFTKMCLDGRLPDPLKNQEAILKECTKANCNVSFVLGRINTQYPLTYSHLVVLMVKVLIYITAIQAGYITAISVIFHYSYWAVTQIIMLTVLTVFHQGLIDIKEHISNPFRKNSTDFSWKIFHSRLCNECKAIFDAGAAPPYTKPERPKPAVLPAQLIVRQIISSRLRH